MEWLKNHSILKFTYDILFLERGFFMNLSTWQQAYCQLRNTIIEGQYDHLNPAQKEAVLHAQGPCLVLAGAGSGKTTMLVNRIGHTIRFGSAYGSNVLPTGITETDYHRVKEWQQNNLDSGEPMPLEISRLLEDQSVDPSSILAITFTNKAAREMKERVNHLLKGQYTPMWISTFHAACARMLRRDIHRLGYGTNFVIYDAQDQQVLLKECLKQLNLSDKKYSPRAVGGWIGKMKDSMIDVNESKKQNEKDIYARNLANIYELYEKKLHQNNALDFDDLILKSLQLFKEAPEVLEYYQEKFQYVLVDEFQDTNKPQYQWVKALAEKHRNLCVVGDDDQSIYGWRGADIENILGFEKDFKDTRIIKLEQNYRSTETILKAANSVVGNNRYRKSKNLFTEGSTGDKIYYCRCGNEYAEADFVAQSMQNLHQEGYPYSDFAVLYRTHAQSRVLEEAMMKTGIPYRIYGGTRFYDRKEIKDILAYLKVIENPKDDLSLKRILNTPRRGIGDKTIGTLEILASDQELSLWHMLTETDQWHHRLTSRASNSLTKFIEQLRLWVDKKTAYSVTELVEEIYTATRYVQLLKDDGSIEAQGRVENLMEFLSLTREFDQTVEEETLEDFLAGTALEAAVDSLEEAEESGVLLMTLHSSKGLEFPVVFMPGLEENVFPSNMSLQEGNEEEERRLCYVGITRAKEKLYLSNAVSRTLYGFTGYNKASRFMEEIPRDCLEELGKEQKSKEAPSEAFQKKQQKQRWQRKEMKPMTVTAGPQHVGENREVKSGQKVTHPVFGSGTIVSKANELVTIAFPGGGLKKINLDYVKLTIEE